MATSQKDTGTNKAKLEHKDHLITAALMAGVFALYNVNKKLGEHMESCEKASANVIKVLVTVASLVAADIIGKLVGALHLMPGG